MDSFLKRVFVRATKHTAVHSVYPQEYGNTTLYVTRQKYNLID